MPFRRHQNCQKDIQNELNPSCCNLLTSRRGERQNRVKEKERERVRKREREREKVNIIFDVIRFTSFHCITYLPQVCILEEEDEET